MSDKLFISALKLLPKNAWSRFIGKVAHAPIPGPLARASIRWFASKYDVNVAEAELPIEEYRSAGDFFTRRLKTGARVVDRRPGVCVSPADGHVLNSGRITSGKIIQAKGKDFSVADLLKDKQEAERYVSGSWLTVYLSPRDYHRVHHPVEGRLACSDYVPGYLWPVNRAAVDNVDELFCVNERVITYVDSPVGRVATIMVGATSVGHITMAYDDQVSSNQGAPAAKRVYPEPIQVARGDELGTFHLGSTAIVLFENPALQLLPLSDGQPITLGEPIAKLD